MVPMSESTVGNCRSKLVCVTTDSKSLAGRWWVWMRLLLCTVCSVPIAVDVSQMSFIHVLSRNLLKQQRSYADEHKEALDNEHFNHERKARKHAEKQQQKETQRQQKETQQMREMIHTLMKQFDEHRRGVQPLEEGSMERNLSTDTEQAGAISEFLEVMQPLEEGSMERNLSTDTERAIATCKFLEDLV
jgi:molecular chaperone DnaK (HSP70)